jgi:hypothetical protein
MTVSPLPNLSERSDDSKLKLNGTDSGTLTPDDSAETSEGEIFTNKKKLSLSNLSERSDDSKLTLNGTDSGTLTPDDSAETSDGEVFTQKKKPSLGSFSPFLLHSVTPKPPVPETSTPKIFPYAGRKGVRTSKPCARLPTMCHEQMPFVHRSLFR